MSVYEQLRRANTNSEFRRVRIVEVNTANRYILARDYSDRDYQISFDFHGSVIQIPVKDEIWLIKSYQTEWRLDRKLELSGVEELIPGDKKISADRVLLDGEVLINGRDTSTFITAADIPAIPEPEPSPEPSGASVGTSVAELGTTYNGKQGLLRVGTSPYDEIPLTYDSTRGKWVGETHWVPYLAGASFESSVARWSTDMTANTLNLVSVGGAHVSPMFIPWDKPWSAGLVMECRWIMNMHHSSSSGGEIRAYALYKDVGAGIAWSSDYRGQILGAGSIPTAAYTLVDTDWINFNGNYKYMVPTLWFASIAAGQYYHIEHASLGYRWISA